MKKLVLFLMLLLLWGMPVGAVEIDGDSNGAVDITKGGTNATTLTNGGLLVGATTAAIEALAVGLTTQVLVGGAAKQTNDRANRSSDV